MPHSVSESVGLGLGHELDANHSCLRADHVIVQSSNIISGHTCQLKVVATVGVQTLLVEKWRQVHEQDGLVGFTPVQAIEL